MSEQVFFQVLTVHLALSAIYATFILLHRSRLPKEFIAVLLFVPAFGILTALLLDLFYLNHNDTKKPQEIQTLTLEENIFWKPIQNIPEDMNIVPLEEAIAINDPQARRKLMLESLYENPAEYIDILMVARDNDDMETVHYASTTISKIQRDFQMRIQELAVSIQNESKNISLLDEYIETMQAYIDSNILEDYLLKRQRTIYDNILEQRIALGGNNKKALLYSLKNHIALRNYQSAVEKSLILRALYPQDENVWIETIRLYVESTDLPSLKKVVNQMNEHDINWSVNGRKIVAQWAKVAQHA